MSEIRCASGDYVVEIRSLLDTPRSIRSSYWVREAGRPGTYCEGPFDTLPEATRAAVELAGRTGVRVWRQLASFLESGDRGELQLVAEAGAGGAVQPWASPALSDEGRRD